MKVLLVVPNLPKKWDWGTLPEPPLGVAWVAAYLKEKHDVAIIDNYFEKLPSAALMRKIRSFSPDAVGISAMTFTEPEAQRLASAVKSWDRGVNVFFGGPHASLFPEKILHGSVADAAIIGEGELTTAAYINAVEKGRALEKIPGIAFKRGRRVTVNKPARYMTDLDSLKFPARDLLKIREYPEFKLSVSLKAPVTTMCTSRGCPFNCLYCSSPTIWGRTWRGQGGKRVVDEMEFLVEKYGVKSVKFHEDHFTFDKKRVLDICREITERGLDVQWQCEARVNNIDRERLEAMKKAGCRIVWYGIESGTQRTLNFYRKGITLEQVREAVKLTNEAGMDAMGSFILGAPLETKAEMEETVKFGLGLGLKEVYFNVLHAFPGTDLYDYVLKNKRVHKYIVGDVAEVAGDVPRAEVVALRTKAQQEVIKRKIRKNWLSLMAYFLTHPAELFSRRTMRTLEFLRNRAD
ncbi:MAG: radical SAM protein [Candidatus Micrarchaeota archaeon]